jgi:hypothetical protein
LENLKQNFQKPGFISQTTFIFWQNIQARFRERPENLPKELNWLMGVKFL